jgi:hypothetical protein
MEMTKWQGTFTEWERAIGYTAEASAALLDCSRRRIFVLKAIESGKPRRPGDAARLTGPERVVMLLALEAKRRAAAGALCNDA